MKLSEMSFLTNSRQQNRKKRPNQSTNNGDIAETAKHYVVCVGEGVSDIYKPIVMISFMITKIVHFIFSKQIILITITLLY